MSLSGNSRKRGSSSVPDTEQDGKVNLRKLRDYLPEDMVMDTPKRLVEYLKPEANRPSPSSPSARSLRTPSDVLPKPSVPTNDGTDDDFDSMVRHAAADDLLDEPDQFEDDATPEEVVSASHTQDVPPTQERGPDSVAKINLLHGVFDRMERTLADLRLEDSNGRAAEAIRERMGRLVHSLSRFMGETTTAETHKNFGGDFPTVYKSPSSVKRLVFDWAAWIGEAQIVKSEWTVPEGLTSTKALYAPTNASVYLGGGDMEKSYIITNRITDTLGRIEERSVVMIVRQT